MMNFLIFCDHTENLKYQVHQKAIPGHENQVPLSLYPKNNTVLFIFFS